MNIPSSSLIWHYADSLEGVIHSIHYHRLILDEAHSIKVRISVGILLSLPPLSFVSFFLLFSLHKILTSSATYHGSGKGMLCPERQFQVVPIWHPRAEPDWGVLLPLALLTGPPSCLLLL